MVYERLLTSENKKSPLPPPIDGIGPRLYILHVNSRRHNTLQNQAIQAAKPSTLLEGGTNVCLFKKNSNIHIYIYIYPL